MASILRKIFFTSPLFTGAIAFLITLGFGLFLSFREFQLKEYNAKEDVENLSKTIEERINAALFTANSAVKVLGYLVQNGEIEGNFHEVGKSIIENIKILDQIQYLDSGTIVNTYPLEGNEIIIGYNILEDPKVLAEAQEAIRRREVFFAGPINLKQGGRAIICRLPLFDENRFTGFAAVLMDWEEFKDEIFAPPLAQEGYTIDLIKSSPELDEAQSLLSADFTDLQGPILETLIPEGNWTLKVQMNQDKSFNEMLLPVGFRFLSALAFGFLFWNFAKQPSILQKKIAQTTHKLKESNQRFQYVSMANSEMIWDWDISTDEVYRSPGFQKFLGYTAEELTSDSGFWLSLIHPDDQAQSERFVKEVFQSQENYWSEELRIKSKSGKYLYVLEKAYILRNDAGKPIRIIGSTQNITEQKESEQKLLQSNLQLQKINQELEESQKKYSGLFDFNPSPIIVHDSETYKIIDINQAAVTKYGYTREEFLKMTILDIRPAKDIPKVQQYLSEFGDSPKKTYRRLSKHLKKNGEIMEVEVSPAKFKIGNKEAAMALVIDLTDKLNYIRKIEQQNELFREIAWIQSHVVRAPLARILGLAQLLDTSAKNLSPDDRELLSYLLASSNELDEIIRDISYKISQVGTAESARKEWGLLEKSKEKQPKPNS
ncbi:PAS domain S-box protein [Algoriphagus vanfongensis]|uniref:PAS domain S-box protein n=1 Tax=Algoriphagus vanfongensis TaxID=426371 RepID=UPI000410E4CC|nr:PAS domain S-box protein [Algoriphagus vanfongensis]